MLFRDYLRTALSNLWRRKLRTLLTILAVVIGATLVALLVSLGAGTQNFITVQFSSLQTPDVVTVQPKVPGGTLGMIVSMTGFGGQPQEVQEGQLNPFTAFRSLTQEDLNRIAAIEHVDRVDPVIVVLARWVKLVGHDKRFQVTLESLSPSELKTRGIAAGRALQEGDRDKALVAYAYLEVWGLASPTEALGKEIEVRVNEGYQVNPFSRKEPEGQDYTFEIVGVLEDNIASTEVIVPYEDGVEMARYFNQDDEYYTDANMGFAASVTVDDPANAKAVAQAIEELGDFGAGTADDAAGELRGFFAVIEGVLSVVGLIALTVASLGIVNTLIMAIYERTREIGVMKAVGASKGTIRFLFTVEAGSIGFFGGVVGVAVAWVVGQIINLIAHATFLKDYPTFNISRFPPWLVLTVIIISTGVALLAGLLPANRAARLDPVEALRYE